LERTDGLSECLFVGVDWEVIGAFDPITIALLSSQQVKVRRFEAACPW
jgi:hypothetical protein